MVSLKTIHLCFITRTHFSHKDTFLMKNFIFSKYCDYIHWQITGGTLRRLTKATYLGKKLWIESVVFSVPANDVAFEGAKPFSGGKKPSPWLRDELLITRITGEAVIPADCRPITTADLLVVDDIHHPVTVAGPWGPQTMRLLTAMDAGWFLVVCSSGFWRAVLYWTGCCGMSL